MGVPGTKSNVKNNVELRHHTTMQVEPCGHFIIIIEWGMRQKTWVILHHYLHEFAFLCLQVNKNQMESNVTIQLVYPIISNSIISTKVSSGFPFYSLQQSAKAWGIKRKNSPLLSSTTLSLLMTLPPCNVLLIRITFPISSQIMGFLQGRRLITRLLMQQDGSDPSRDALELWGQSMTQSSESESIKLT